MTQQAPPAYLAPRQPSPYTPSPAPPPHVPPASELVQVPSMAYTPTVDGECGHCGYVNRNRRNSCKVCREPLSAPVPAAHLVPRQNAVPPMIAPQQQPLTAALVSPNG